MPSPKLAKEIIPLSEEGKVLEIKMFISNEGGPQKFAAHANIGDYSVVGFADNPKHALEIMTHRLVNDMPVGVPVKLNG